MPLQLADADATAALPPVADTSPPPSGLTGFLHKLFGRQLASANPDVAPTVDGHTAIYDIEARTVFMPNGERLEAHSGLGAMMDDPHYASRKDRGPTPPPLRRRAIRRRPPAQRASQPALPPAPRTQRPRRISAG